MKLRTKLLLGVGILLFAMVIVLYIIPTYFVRQDVYKAADQIHALLAQEHDELIQSQQTWLDNVLAQMQEQIDATLFIVYEEPQEAAIVQFSPNNPSLNVWEGITRMAASDPDIGFVQAHNPEEEKTAVITLPSAHFYPIDSLRKEQDLILITLHDLEEGERELAYIGVQLPEEFQTEAGYRLYALIDPKEAQAQLKVVEKEIEELRKKTVEKRPLDIDIEPHLHDALYWAVKVDMIRHLTPLFVEGLDFKEIHTFVPQGLARLDEAGNGYALLTKEVFHTTPFFNDRLYFERHMPGGTAPPLATGSVFITSADANQAYIGNTLRNGKTFLTVGYSLGSLVSQLALSSNKMVLLRVGDNFWIGYDGTGKKLPQSNLDQILKTGLLDQHKGILKIDGKNFAFSRISSLAHGELVFYGFDRLGGEKSILQTLISLENKLTEKISLQLSLISLVTMVLVLLFIARMGFGIIYPVTRLAKATEDVAHGRYDQVVLPDVGRRKDEVATLTHSFGQMVQGLKDRERIRGVLDKVVSKDVADEILKSQVHLGGEDRVVTMLFSDIRGFTHMTEELPPQKTIEMLNACMTKVSRVIEGEGGVIDKYVGDEVMALYGAPATHPDHALRAVSAGMLIIETLKKWNEERVKEGLPPVQMGIGINTGLVVVGNMGAEDRLNYTVLGAHVNLASRLCDVAKPGELIISHHTLKEPQIEDSFFVEPLEPITLKGFTEPVQIYRVMGFKWEG